MTEQKAIEWLKAISATQSESIHTNSLSERKEALHIGIVALETVEEIKQFFEAEIEQTEERLKEPCYMFDGVEVSEEQAEELNKSHIRFSKGILRIIEKSEG